MTTKGQQTFEFTKRKRWTDTLFQEASDTLFFVVSSDHKVLYCGSAIVELLGWREEQLVDADLSSFIEDEDVGSFLRMFSESLLSGHDLFIYTRFKYGQLSNRDPDAKPSLLCELKGHPRYTKVPLEPQCFFLSAMPYPSRNIALLNSFLELKVENDNLSQRIHDLKSSLDSPTSLSTLSQSYQSYPHSGPLVPNHSSASAFSRFPPTISLKESVIDDGLDDYSRRKKMKKTFFPDEHRVCMICGRTDSPEWRKGPNGPKTLCNACGLRWAKRTRRMDPEPIASGSGQAAGDVSSRPVNPKIHENSDTQGSLITNSHVDPPPLSPDILGQPNHRHQPHRGENFTSNPPASMLYSTLRAPF